MDSKWTLSNIEQEAKLEYKSQKLKNATNLWKIEPFWMQVRLIYVIQTLWGRRTDKQNVVKYSFANVLFGISWKDIWTFIMYIIMCIHILHYEGFYTQNADVAIYE